MCFVVLASGLALGQAGTPSNGAAGSPSVADELKALREAISEQQKQIAQQQQQIQTLQKDLNAKTAGTPHVTEASLTTSTSASPSAPAVQSDVEKAKESPLSFRIGAAEFTPGGFVDFENVFRSTNLGSGISTSYGALPYNNTIQGHLTEFRTTGQYSRLSLKTHAKFGANDVTGYLEMDFNGNDAANVFDTTNPHTDRLRLYWLDLKRGKWEFLGGQSWGWMTPNRNGIGPMPSDLALTIGEDANVHVGVTHTRAGQFRAVWHPNDKFAWGIGIENPYQIVGAGEVIFPFAFNAALGPQLQAANQTTVPNAAPDVLSKMAYDTQFGGGRHFHIELGGIMRTFRITNVPIGGTTFAHHTSIGGGAEFAMNVDIFKSLRFLTNGFYSNGGGRYGIALGPDVVVRPIATGPGTFDIDISKVHTTAGTIGFEAQATPKTLFGFYYGGEYFQRNAFPDVTSPLVIKPIIGFGGINSPNSANRAIQEASAEWTQTMWKNPQYGALLLVTQYSYLTRAPWFVAGGAPKNAHLSQAYLSIRYVLP